MQFKNNQENYITCCVTMCLMLSELYCISTVISVWSEFRDVDSNTTFNLLSVACIILWCSHKGSSTMQKTGNRFVLELLFWILISQQFISNCCSLDCCITDPPPVQQSSTILASSLLRKDLLLKHNHSSRIRASMSAFIQKKYCTVWTNKNKCIAYLITHWWHTRAYTSALFLSVLL